jgi:hypothetical protein
MRNPFAPDFLACAAEQLGCDATPAGQAKRLEDLKLLRELIADTQRWKPFAIARVKVLEYFGVRSIKVKS